MELFLYFALAFAGGMIAFAIFRNYLAAIVGVVVSILLAMLLLNWVFPAVFAPRTTTEPPSQTPAAVVVLPPPPVAPVAATCALANVTSKSPQGPSYDATWDATCDNLEQRLLPSLALTNRKAHTVSIEIPKGNWFFNGVACRLHLDPMKNGKGFDNPMTVGLGNGIPFSVTGDSAWAAVSCEGNASTGFAIRAAR
jgi:hypothetical protein